MKKLIYILILFLFFGKPSYALVQVDITRGNLNPLPIAVSPLYVESGSIKILENLDVGSEISKLIETNFKRSGLFNPLNKQSFVQKPDIVHLKPRFEDWRLIKAQALITGKVLIKDQRWM